jgi:hypothetical protein
MPAGKRAKKEAKVLVTIGGRGRDRTCGRSGVNSRVHADFMPSTSDYSLILLNLNHLEHSRQGRFVSYGVSPGPSPSSSCRRCQRDPAPQSNSRSEPDSAVGSRILNDIDRDAGPHVTGRRGQVHGQIIPRRSCPGARPPWHLRQAGNDCLLPLHLALSVSSHI